MSEPKSKPTALTDWRRRTSAVAAGLLLLVVVAAGLMLSGGRFEPVPGPAAGAGEPSARSVALRRQISAQAPSGTYAVIDTYANRLRVYRQGSLLREAVCSTGSGLVLRDTEGGREWVFDTPLGERRVEEKTRNPVWIKPDWAFVEEGFAPPEEPRERVDSISLGDYGIYLGDGYLIHGTLFKSLLGQKITHGCIRLGDEDLEFVYRRLPVGARVFLF